MCFGHKSGVPVCQKARAFKNEQNQRLSVCYRNVQMQKMTSKISEFT